MPKSCCQFYNDDCRKILPFLKSNSFDAIIADPPYGINYRSRRGERIQNDETPFIWWADEAYRVLRDPGAIICFCRWDVAECFRLALVCAGFRVRSQVVWNKLLHGQGDVKSAFAPCHELAWFATKGKFVFPGRRPKSVISRTRVCRNQIHPNQKPVLLMRDIVSAVAPSNGRVLDIFMGSGSAGVACANLGCSYTGIECDKKYFQIAKARVYEAQKMKLC